MAELRSSECRMTATPLRSLALAALETDCGRLAYAASAKGLAGREQLGWFLLLRARSLPWRFLKRRALCVRAAIELARRERDDALVSEALDSLHEEDGMLPWACTPREGAAALAPEEVAQVLAEERNAGECPETGPGPVDDMLPLGREGDHEEDDDELWPVDSDEDLPPELMKDFLEEIERLGPAKALGLLAELEEAAGRIGGADSAPSGARRKKKGRRK